MKNHSSLLTSSRLQIQEKGGTPSGEHSASDIWITYEQSNQITPTVGSPSICLARTKKKVLIGLLSIASISLLKQESSVRDVAVSYQSATTLQDRSNLSRRKSGCKDVVRWCGGCGVEGHLTNVKASDMLHLLRDPGIPPHLPSPTPMLHSSGHEVRVTQRC